MYGLFILYNVYVLWEGSLKYNTTLVIELEVVNSSPGGQTHPQLHSLSGQTHLQLHSLSGQTHLQLHSLSGQTHLQLHSLSGQIPPITFT